MGQNNHNNTSDTNVDDSDTAAEFNQIYNNLVAKIRSRVNRPELPAIGKREEPRGDAPKPETGEREGVGDMIAVLRRTLRAGQQEEDRKC